jgi:hypothetical protein
LRLYARNHKQRLSEVAQLVVTRELPAARLLDDPQPKLMQNAQGRLRMG